MVSALGNHREAVSRQWHRARVHGTRWERRQEMAASETSSLRPLVSVVVSTYNHGQYLAQAIESIVGQRTAFDFEVLIGDDCSRDNTQEIAEEYQSRYPERIRVFTTDRNLGPHDNDVRLTQASRGKYLAYCEGDDYWNTPDKLAKQVGFLEANPEYGAVHSEYSRIAQFRGEWRCIPRAWEQQGRAIPEGAVFHDMLRTCLMQTCTVVVRKDLMLGFYSSGLPVEQFWPPDWACFVYLSHETLVGYIDEPLATYRKVPGSMMNQSADVVLARHHDNTEMLMVLCDYFEVDEATRMDVRWRMTLELFRHALRAGDFKSARSAYEWLDAHAHTRPAGSLPWPRRLVYRWAARHPALATLFQAADVFNQRVGVAALTRRRAFSTKPPIFES